MSDPLPSASSSSSSSAEGAANGSDSTSASSLSKPPPPPPPPVPPPTKTTPALHSSLTALHSLLTCPLCQETYSTPSTLSCGHTFCLDCIGHYACDNWECPKEGCSQPISMGGPGGGGLGRRNYSGTEAEGGGDEMKRAGGGGVGGRGGGFARTNPILEGSVTSLNRILRVLNDAPDGWWKDSDKSAKRKGKKKKKKKKKEQNQKEKKKEQQQQQQRIREKQDDEEGEEGGGRRNGRKSAVTFQEDEEEMVDFNPTPNDNDGGDADADDGDGDDDDDSITVSDDIGGTPFGDNTGTITGRPHRSNKPIEEVVCPSQATSASLSANHSQTQSQATNATALPSERDSLLQGLGLGLTDRSVEEPNDATSSAGNGRSSGIPLSHTSGILPSSQQQHPQYSSRLDTTALPAQRDSLLADLDLGLDLGPTDPTGSNEGEGEGVDNDFCTATSRQDNDDGQMTDGTNGTRSTMNTNQYLTGREEDADDMEEAQGGDDDDDEDGDDNDNDGGMDSEATMSYPFPGPSPATERKSNTRMRSSRGGSSNNNSSNNLRQLAQLSRCDTLNSVASSIGAAAGGGREAGNNLSTLEEGSCETSTANTTHSSTKASTAAAEGEGRDRRRGSVEERKGAAEMDQDSDHSDDEQQEEPSQCQSLLGQVNKMERQLDSALADAIRSPSPRADRSGSRSGLDQSCAIPQGDDFVEDDEEGPVFGSQGLSPILIAGSQRDVGFGSDEDERESEGEGEDSKPASQSKSIKSKERDPVRESIGSLNTSASSRLATQPPSPDTVEEKETRSSRRSGGYSEEPETSPPDKGAKRKASSRPFMRQYTVSAASKPEVFLLSDFSALTTADVRAIRKCLKQNLVGILKPLVEANEEDSNVATGVDGNSDLDLSFDFETPDGRDSFLTTLASKKAAGVGLYGVCSDSVFALADGYVVPRSFRYLLAVASAIPMVDLSYLSNNSSGKGGRGSSPRYLLPPGSSENDNDVRSGKRARRETSRTSKDPSINPDTNLPYIVYGDCDSKEYGAPQRSLASANGLFDGYVCLFFGEFDHCASKSARVGGRKRARTTNVNDCDLYSEGRLSLLLKLCGGAVANLKQVVEAMEASGSSGTSSARLSPDTNEIVNIFNSSRIRQDRLIIILRTKANARDRKLARKFLAHHSGSSGSISYLNEAPVVCADWALDSIGEFAVQDLATYQ